MESIPGLFAHLSACDHGLARRAEMLWELAAPIHARQTRVDANEGGEAHCRRVEQYIWDLIRHSGSVDEYRPIELFLLSCAACCHDFDKGLGSVFRDPRPHGEGSGDFVYEHAGRLVLNRHEADIIARIIRLHDRTGDNFAAGLSELPFDHPLGSDSIDLQRLAVVLKAGDVLHTDGTRNSDLNARGIALQPAESFMNLLLAELVAVTNAESRSPWQAIYPPYLQMIVERLAMLAEGGSAALQAYKELGVGFGPATEYVIAAYLSDNIDRIGERGHDAAGARRVLTTLSRTSGKKGAVNASRISAEVGVPTRRLNPLLREMVSLRLVRRLATGQWEIAHDLLARRVAEDILDDAERRFKHAREALESKARMLGELKSLLTPEELRILWLARERVPLEDLNHNEQLLILLSMFALDVRMATIDGLEASWLGKMTPGNQTVPGWYWLHGLSRQDLQQLVFQAMDLDTPEVVIALVRLAALLGGQEWLPALAEVMKMEWEGFEGLKKKAGKIIAKLATVDHIPVLLGMLEDNNVEVSLMAAAELSQMVPLDNLPLMKNKMKESENNVQDASAEELGNLASQNEMRQLKSMLKDRDWKARRAAVERLGKFGSRDDLSLVWNMLKDYNYQVQIAATETFGKLASRDDLPLLLSMLMDKDHYARKASVEALGKLVSPDDLVMLRKILDGNRFHELTEMIDLLRKLASQVDPPQLRNMVKDSNNYVRVVAAEELGKLGSRDDLPLLESMLKDSTGKVRKAAVKAIGELGLRDDLPLLESMLKDSNGKVRKASVEAIRKLISRDALPLFRDMLRDSEEDVRKAVVKSYGEFGGFEHVKLIANQRIDRDKDVREATGKAIFAILTRAIESEGVHEEDVAAFLQNHGEELSTPVLNIFDWVLYAPSYIKEAYAKSEKD